MGISWAWYGVLLYLALFPTPFPISVRALPGGYLTVNSCTSWTNTLSAPDSVIFNDGLFVKNILSTGSTFLDDEYACGCGFFYNQTYNSSLFVIFSLHGSTVDDGPEVVWSANPSNPVGINARLQLTSERGLVLQDANGTIAWSTNISSKSVAALNLTDTCNLMLLDENNATIWQSFDHPTDTLVLGQKLVAGQNLTSEGGLYSLSLTGKGLFFYINSNPPLCYFSYTTYISMEYSTVTYAQFLNGNLTIYEVESKPTDFDGQLKSDAAQYMRLDPDGHLRVYTKLWIEEDDFPSERVGYCGYPMACGNYGICTKRDHGDPQCSCPQFINGTSYFRPINNRLPNRGCSLATPLSCEASKNHILLELKNVTYFPFSEDLSLLNPDHGQRNLESCKQACLKDCLCTAIIYD